MVYGNDNDIVLSDKTRYKMENSESSMVENKYTKNTKFQYINKLIAIISGYVHNFKFPFTVSWIFHFFCLQPIKKTIQKLSSTYEIP